MFIQPIPMWWGSNDNWAYLVVDDESRDALIIDPANPEEVIPVLIAAVQSNKLNLVAVINTHYHWDHAGGNEEIVTPNLTLSEARTVKESRKLQVMDSICFFFQDGDQKAVFTGDTLFIGGCGRFFEGTAEEMHVALNKHLASLPDDTVVFPGHEYTRSNAKFAISVLQSYPVQQLLGFSDANPVTQHNVFMRLDDPDIQRATGETDPVSVMEKLREMKNEYK
ncbi:hydroxyacylglutathione hydrolase [Fusarium sp. NRRL 25303]|nr:hydroxyacylglutathione hydrolase [Fusarium sp. NRRL 25303]